MNLSDLSIRNPVFAWMLSAFLIVFGLICFDRLGVSQMPDVDFPTVRVEVALEGASPEIMETEVVDVLEDAVMSVQGIQEITATARQGRASLNIEFEIGRDIDAAVQEVQTKIAQAQRLLPHDIDPPTVEKTNADDNAFMWIALSGHVPYPDLVHFARYRLKDRLQTVPGVGEVILGGYLDRNMRIWLKLEELEARDLTVADVIAALGREHVEVPAGRLESSTRESNVRAFGEAPSAEEFRSIVIAHRNDAPVFLGDVAVVEDGLADRRRLARALGVQAVGLGIKKQYGANAVQVARAVRERIREIQPEVPPGMTLEVNSDITVFVEESIHEIQFTLVLSVILTSIVCWLFLGSWTSTLNVLLAIPTSIVGSFILLYALGFTINTFTLMALSLAVGIVVDDAIMVLENIVRHRERGEPRARAARNGTREIMMAAFAATLAIIAIFLPIAFVQGLIGKFLYQFGVTLSVAVALSLLEAITLTPMRCAQMLSVADENRFLSRFFRGLANAYRAVLAPCLRWRWAVVALSMAGFGASLFLLPRLRQEIVPPQDQSMVLVRFQTPVGSSIDYTDARLREAERFLEEQRTRGPVNRYFSVVGGFGGGDVDTGVIFMTLKPRRERPPSLRNPGEPMSQHEFMGILRARLNSIPGMRGAYVSDLSMRGLTGRGTTFPIEFAVTGDDWARLGEYSERLMEKMRETGLLVDVHSDYLVGMPEVRVYPDRRRAAELGVSMLDIGTAINALIGGVRVGKFEEGGHRYDMRVRLVSDQRSRPEDIERLTVRSRDGRLVKLSEVVRLVETPGVQSITRRNRARAITVRANLAPGASQKTASERIRAIAREVLPPGYGLEETGSSRFFSESGRAFLFAIGLGVVVAYMVLASQFNSYVHPVLVLLAMPFSVTGALAALWAADQSLNMYSMIGIVLLMGIVKKNSILLVEFTNQLRQRGRGVREALLEACPIRLRPVLMTSISTIAAALPPALALGPGAETRIPMALVVIGGMAVSTLLTLFVVPCAYLILPGRVRPLEDEAPEEPRPAEEPAVPAARPGP
ncbi:MAG TPA: efflux RND transporter permease subunit [Planctomycetota bacterium]|nr:efflux RND transporter permease subunit [Planctomycetota bacterium]